MLGLFLFSSYVSGEEVEVDLNLNNGECAFTFMDLPSGESTIVQNSEGQTLLIDTGDKDTEAAFSDRLDMYHVDKIDELLLTSSSHYHSGNLEWLFDHYDIDNVYLTDKVYQDVEELIIEEGTNVSIVEEGNTFEMLPEVRAEVLYSFDQGEDGADGVAFMIHYGEHEFLYSVVSDETVEEMLVEKRNLKSEVLKVADFASDKATSEAFVEEVDPQIAVIFSNRNRPPSASVLERLHETWIDIFQTSRLGSVSLKCNYSDYEVVTVRGGDV